MNANDIKREAEKRLAEIATHRAALDAEEAQLRAMLGAPAAPVPVVLPPIWIPYVTYRVEPYIPPHVTPHFDPWPGGWRITCDVGGGVLLVTNNDAPRSVAGEVHFGQFEIAHGRVIDGTQFYA